jgi:hypothetical protein
MMLKAIVAACAFCLAAISGASASTLRYDFAVMITSGPLIGQSYDGSFAFDSGAIIPGGGTNDAADLLTDLDFTFNGVAYDAATANTGWLGFDSSGALTDFSFGLGCAPGVCYALNPGAWYAQPANFVYVYLHSNIGKGVVSYSAATPEPSTWAMLLIAFGGLGFVRWRASSALATSS